MPSTPRVRTLPAQGQRELHLHGWTITTTKRPILSIPEADAASAALDLALPEICFGNNALALTHEPSGFRLEWTTLDLLRAVKKGPGWDSLPGAGPVRVAHADQWSRGQAASGSTTRLTVQKPFDWTYTTLHPGRIASSPPPSATPEPEWQPAPPSHPGIPLPLLARTDIPILFFDEIPMFEDELGDNGIADLTVRVRVNHLSIFVLSRFALRIDGVLFRHLDVRLFHRFGTDELVRETKGREAPYHLVRARLTGSSSRQPSRTGSTRGESSAPLPASATGATYTGAGSQEAADLTPLTDINWVASVLEELAQAEGNAEAYGAGGTGTGTGERQGESASSQWEGLGRRLEVLKVPWAATAHPVPDEEAERAGTDPTAGMK